MRSEKGLDCLEGNIPPETAIRQGDAQKRGKVNTRPREKRSFVLKSEKEKENYSL